MTAAATLRIATGQAPSVPGDLAANVATAVELARSAAAQGARLLVLPEAFLVGYAPDAFAALPRPGVLVHAATPLAEAARDLGITVVVGAAVRRPQGNRLTLLVASPDGSIDLPYDKQHLDSEEKNHFILGDHGTVIEVDGHRLGLSICYDGCFPEHARRYAEAGVLAYLNAAAWFVGGEHRRDLHAASRALENGFYTVFSGLTGRCGPYDFSGGSGVHDPEGRTVVQMGTETGVVVADLDPALVVGTRSRHTMVADHRDMIGPGLGEMVIA
ncbi:MAG: carbon-nitrogen hydrolase family protein [Nocardioides sp.]